MSSIRGKVIGLLLSVAWIAIVGFLGLNRISAEVHRDFMQCYRIRMAVQSDPRCVEPDVGPNLHWCALKNMECRSGLPPDKVGFVAALALGPPLVGWLLARVWRSRQRRTAI